MPAIKYATTKVPTGVVGALMPPDDKHDWHLKETIPLVTGEFRSESQAGYSGSPVTNTSVSKTYDLLFVWFAHVAPAEEHKPKGESEWK